MPIYGPPSPVKAWVNFDGVAAGTSIRAAHNVASITDNGVGDYRVNFAGSMPDAAYCTVATVGHSFGGGDNQAQTASGGVLVGSVRVLAAAAGVLSDFDYINVAVFR